MGFSYNDITSKSMGLKARLTSWQVSGSLRNFTTTVPGKYGVTDFGADFDYREIVVSCSIFPRHSFSALVSTLDDIAAWLDPVGGLKQLVLDDVPDRYFMARLNAAVECERLLPSARTPSAMPSRMRPFPSRKQETARSRGSSGTWSPTPFTALRAWLLPGQAIPSALLPTGKS